MLCPEHHNFIAMNLKNKTEKCLHIGPNVKITKLIYSFFFPFTSMHFEPIQINLPRSVGNAGGKMRQGEVVALSGRG